jgi:hypothetical protein
VFWVSDPVAPGQTVLVYGDGFSGASAVRWERLADVTGTKAVTGTVTPAQARPHCVKFVLPPNVRPGMFRAKIDTPSGTAEIEINKPQLLWAQGDAGTPGTPGGFIRVCGKCLTSDGRAASIRLVKNGTATLLTPHRSEPFTLEAKLPAKLATGEYQVSVSSGVGLNAGWSTPVKFTVNTPTTLPATVFDAPPPSDNVADNAPAVQKVLDQAGEHGGTVRFPAGRWLFDTGLTIPRNVTLQGLSMNRTALCWIDMAAPPPALLLATDHFKIADMSIYARQYKRGIVSDLTTPTAGNVTIDRVRMRLNRFRNHMKPEEVNARYISAGDGDAIRVGGENVEIVGCDVYSSGRPIFLSRTVGGRVFDNQFFIGRDGWYCLSGNNGLLFERNVITGTDLQASGGGINTLDGSIVSQNVYYANNIVKSVYGGDHEGMTSDGPGGIYYGKIASVKGKVLTTATDLTLPKWRKDWTGGAVFIMDGKGQGQYRQVVSIDGRDLTLESPWAVEPDDTSLISITIVSRNYLLIGNTFTDTGVALQMYGSSVGHIASNNTSERTGGYYCFGRNYRGVQPCWYIMWLNNKIIDGTVYMAGPNSMERLGEAQIAIQGANPNVTPLPAMTIGIVARGNELMADAHIEVTAEGAFATFPLVQDVVVEQNRVSNAKIGLIIGPHAAGVLSRSNIFTNCGVGIRAQGDVTTQADTFPGCGNEIVDDRARIKAEAAEGAKVRAKLDTQPGPLLRLACSATTTAAPFADVTGHGFDGIAEGRVVPTPGPHGLAAQFDGKSCLKLAHPTWLRTSSFTFAAWVKPDAVLGNFAIASKRYDSVPSPFILVASDDKLLVDGNDSDGNWWKDKVMSPSVLRVGSWTHVAVVEEAGAAVSLYVNGKLVASGNHPVPRSLNDEPLVIGRDPWWVGNPEGVTPPALQAFTGFRGAVADIQLWSRSLTPSEVANLAGVVVA